MKHNLWSYKLWSSIKSKSQVAFLLSPAIFAGPIPSLDYMFVQKGWLETFLTIIIISFLKK